MLTDLYNTFFDILVEYRSPILQGVSVFSVFLVTKYVFFCKSEEETYFTLGPKLFGSNSFGVPKSFGPSVFGNNSIYKQRNNIVSYLSKHA